MCVDLQYVDGESRPGIVAQFDSDKPDWQYAETIAHPEKRVKSAHFYTLVKENAGTVWLDDLFFGPAEGENLLREPGFETCDLEDVGERDAILDTYESLHANAIHTYIGGPPAPWFSELMPRLDQDRDLLAEMLDATRQRGLGVVVTTHPLYLPIDNADDPDFPQYACVNGPWGDRWVALLSELARYPLMGISLVPDEFNWTNGELARRFSDHPEERVRQFFQSLPRYCECPVCQHAFREQYGEPMPPMGPWWRPPDQTDAYRKWINFRYHSTTDWIARCAAAVKTANPSVRADSLLSNKPICNDFRLGPGAAWDMVGYRTSIDLPTTDPYIISHNHQGDSTHWYVTETATHLVGSTPKRKCGVVLQSSRLRAEHRPLDPVEIYGGALSAVSRGATELAWWHYDGTTNQSSAAQGEISRACAGGAYELLEMIDPWLAGARPLRRVALLYSRASEEYFSFYTHPEPSELLTHQTEDPRYSFLAQKEVLYYLFRRGIPTDLYYLDQVSAAELADYPTIVVPFPFAVGEQQRQLLTRLAEAGKALLVISEFGTVSELGAPNQPASLLSLCGLAESPTGVKRGRLAFPGDSPRLAGQRLEGFTTYGSVRPAQGVRVWATVGGTPAILEHCVGGGRIVFLAGEYGIGLPESHGSEGRSRRVRIQPSRLSSEHVRLMDALLEELCRGTVSLIRRAPAGKDVEVAAMRNEAGDLLLFAINWEGEPAHCQFALPGELGVVGTGCALDSMGRLSKVQVHATAAGSGLHLAVDLHGQEARVVRFPAGATDRSVY